MNNIYQTHKAKIIGMRQESPDTKLFRIQFVEGKIQSNFDFLPGQFVQVGIPGWGECPISICSSNRSHRFFELAIRDVGALTHQINMLRTGDVLDIRGPFGNGFDIEKFKDKPLILVGGGCGFIPLRSLILDYVGGRLQNTVLQIFYGCQNEQTILFAKEHKEWAKYSELDVILDKPSKSWAGKKGLVTDLFAERKITSNSVAVLVGPPVMYKFVIKELKKKKVADENIFLSLERKMYCGVGVCQHCAIGPYYVCKDGPVFSWAQLKNVPEAV